ncbi:winged helix-turn-helix domain-containing protein [Nonomuraea typhae]|uniref:GntR family transcriptional regulator n=1 Tax=Nonomuraea typhae TaxID=2603600 RepID=UPI0012FA4175|nr:winged helix-turn-helix domain-containing protein [Nonomuraea typhae]
MLDPEGVTHIYIQLASILRGRIAASPPGTPVASEAELQQEFRIARSTARRAIQVLREDGLVHTIPGDGTFVGPPGQPRHMEYWPAYQRIAAGITERILAGSLLPNRRIPSEKVLMEQYGVAKATARKAVAHLREQGWVFTVPSRGTYVSPQETWPKT